MIPPRPVKEDEIAKAMTSLAHIGTAPLRLIWIPFSIVKCTFESEAGRGASVTAVNRSVPTEDVGLDDLPLLFRPDIAEMHPIPEGDVVLPDSLSRLEHYWMNTRSCNSESLSRSVKQALLIGRESAGRQRRSSVLWSVFRPFVPSLDLLSGRDGRRATVERRMLSSVISYLTRIPPSSEMITMEEDKTVYYPYLVVQLGKMSRFIDLVKRGGVRKRLKEDKALFILNFKYDLIH